MTYQDFLELEHYDLVSPNRGRYLNCIFFVDYIDEEEETVHATWSDMNERPTPEKLPSLNFGRHSLDILD